MKMRFLRPCTARVPGKPQQPKRPESKARAPQERPASRSSPNDQKGKPVRRRSARQAAAAQTTRKESPRAAGALSPNTRKKKQPIFTKIEKACSQNAPQDFEKGNLAYKVVLLLMCAFSPPRGLKTGPPDQQQPRRNQHGWF